MRAVVETRPSVQTNAVLGMWEGGVGTRGVGFGGQLAATGESWRRPGCGWDVARLLVGLAVLWIAQGGRWSQPGR